MDAGLAIKPATGVAVSDFARPASVLAQGSVPTDLAAGRSVTASPATADTRQNLPSPQEQMARRQSAQDNLSRGYTVDPQTREVIFRVIDIRTRQVVRQVPEAAMLRMHAYAQALARGDGAPTDIQTDISA